MAGSWCAGWISRWNSSRGGDRCERTTAAVEVAQVVFSSRSLLSSKVELSPIFPYATVFGTGRRRVPEPRRLCIFYTNVSDFGKNSYFLKNLRKKC